MRKFQKEQLLDIITSLHTLHQETKIRLEKKEYQTVQTALSDCQEAAIRMGEAIERIEGEGAEVVSCLEQYCERVYETSTQLEKLTAQKFYKNLEEMLIKAENAIKHMPVRKEVVFFPYKASMWDSLESVYLAAKEDGNCDAYCVPIPYYDRRSDGSIGQMHYEGNEYPKNIEVIDYRTYNLEERHPDAIYIHNPYDEWNHVTCVPERYFAKNLRNYTDQLVYIPYFVLDEIEPDDQVRIEGMKHFCFTPGVIYSHKVIVQSEKMRQIYINEYIKAAKECGLSGEHTDRKYLESKILGTGSPKIDKVLHTKKEDLEIPEEWLKIIEKPDGTWKKIIFYNTSVSALLQYSEKMLEKMKYVFRIFKENKENIALLWRPHPLIKATIESMRPQLWEEYRKIVEQYRSESWGIYDDSADLDRAVVLSDAYYGDGSSVVELYKRTGKRTALQDCNALKEYKKSLFARTWVIVNNCIYFAIANGNGLFICDMDKGEISFVGSFPNEKTDQWYLYSGSFIYDKYIVFLPNFANNAGVYDVEEKIFVENMWLNIPKGGRCVQRIKADAADIYIFGTWNDPYIYKFVPQKDRGYYILPDAKANGGKAQERMDMYGMCRVDTHIYFPVFNRECIKDFDLESEELCEVRLPERGYHYVAVAFFQDIFYLLEDSGILVSYDMQKKELDILFDIKQEGKQAESGMYNRLLCIEGCLYLMPNEGPVVRYEIGTGQVQFPSLFPSGIRDSSECYQRKIISFYEEKKSLEIVDWQELVKKEIALPDEEGRTVVYETEGILTEQWGSILQLLMEMLKVSDAQIEKNNYQYEQLGNMIYQTTGK